MNTENICKLNIIGVPQEEDIVILNFVYEKNTKKISKMILYAAYRINLVTSGYGYILTNGKKYPLKRGDLFFTFPSTPFQIVELEQLEYVYISFNGTSQTALYKRANISPNDFIINNMERLIEFWINCVEETSINNIDLFAKSVINYSFAIIVDLPASDIQRKKQVDSVISKIKNDIDKEFSSPELSLYSICEKYSYNPNYISTQFRNIVGLNFNEYLQRVRIQNAIFLMKSTNKSIKEIALLSGYVDSLYFSKIFKKTMGVSPTEFINSLK